MRNLCSTITTLNSMIHAAPRAARPCSISFAASVTGISRSPAVGFQAHLYGERPIDRDGVARFARDLKALDLHLLVTELDWIDWRMPADIAERDACRSEAVYGVAGGCFGRRDAEGGRHLGYHGQIQLDP